MVRNVILKPFVFQQFALRVTSISHKVVKQATLILLQ